jgi:folate-dependent phosphoribosylglycinamide formyltransferase PurN
VVIQNKKIVFLASDGESSRWVYNALKRDFVFETVIIEKPVSKKVLFKARIKRIGFFKVLGQAMFSALVVPLLRKKAAVRKSALVQQYNLSNTDFDDKTYRVDSVNDETCKQLLQQVQPDIVIVNGTRIISKKILSCSNAVFINMHVGITPWYRGSHGGYWALYNNDVENFGTTIHLIDIGVDTGAILKQAFVKPTKEDNFTTYPVLQVAEGIKGMKIAITEAIENKLVPKSNSEKGKMYYQPTIWQYLTNKIK